MTIAGSIFSRWASTASLLLLAGTVGDCLGVGFPTVGEGLRSEDALAARWARRLPGLGFEHGAGVPYDATR